MEDVVKVDETTVKIMKKQKIKLEGTIELILKPVLKVLMMKYILRYISKNIKENFEIKNIENIKQEIIKKRDNVQNIANELNKNQIRENYKFINNNQIKLVQKR